MWVKVDYSTEAKRNPRPDMAGMWAIYTKRHWWNKWVERDTYADVDWCNRQAKKLVEYPKVYWNRWCVTNGEVIEPNDVKPIPL